MKTPMMVLVMVIVLAVGWAALRPTQSSALPESTWDITCVDCPRTIVDTSDRSLRLDVTGRPHIAYGGDHLYYAYRDGSLWRSEVADKTNSVGSYASLAFAPSGQPRISYTHQLTCPTQPFDETCSNLRFAYKDAAGWHTETVYQGGYVASTSLAVDSVGYAHIAFWDRDWVYYVHQSASASFGGAPGRQLSVAAVRPPLLSAADRAALSAWRRC